MLVSRCCMLLCLRVLANSVMVMMRGRMVVSGVTGPQPRIRQDKAPEPSIINGKTIADLCAWLSKREF